MPEVNIREVVYKQFGKCVEISNGTVDLLVTVDLGPRIIRFGFIGGENEFAEKYEAKVPGEDTWKIYGGHRMWHSPENNPRTYSLDDEPVEWAKIDNGIRVSQKLEPWVQIKKDMEITLSACCNKVKVVHKLTNKNAWPVELSAWGLSVMAPGGVQVIPQSQRDTGLLGNRVLTLWSYSKMNDHRIHWGDKFIVFRQDPNMKPPFKFGISNEDGWAAYFNHGNLFVKKYMHFMNVKYPDFGVSFETYTTDFMMEMETLSPLMLLNPGQAVTHAEEWNLIKDIALTSEDETYIQNIADKHINSCCCCK